MSTVADAALALLNVMRGSGGLGAQQCTALEEVLRLSAAESQLLTSSGEALRLACGQAKTALLGCRAPDGDTVAAAERQRCIGTLADMEQGLTNTAGVLVQLLAVAVSEVAAARVGQPAKLGQREEVLQFHPPRGPKRR